MSDHRTTWSEEATTDYLDASPVAVPSRAEQLAVILTLLPFDRDEAFTVAELGCGEGLLGEAIVTLFPHARYVALDGSEGMREATAERLHDYRSRVEILPFDLLAEEWRDQLDGVDAVVSSLVVHHLDHEGKAVLFRDIHDRLTERGIVLIADLLEPANDKVNRYFAETYDAAAREQSEIVYGSDEGYQHFLKLEWNHYLYPDPHSDRPARLFDQLRWLGDAGFSGVDCFWLRAGHAIFGGFKTERVAPAGISYVDALAAAQRVLQLEQGER